MLKPLQENGNSVDQAQGYWKIFLISNIYSEPEVNKRAKEMKKILLSRYLSFPASSCKIPEENSSCSGKPNEWTSRILSVLSWVLWAVLLTSPASGGRSKAQSPCPSLLVSEELTKALGGASRLSLQNPTVSCLALCCYEGNKAVGIPVLRGQYPLTGSLKAKDLKGKYL